MQFESLSISCHCANGINSGRSVFLYSGSFGREKLVKKYADEPDDDGNVKVAEVHIPAFSTAMGELLEEEFEIEGIKPIKFPEGLKLSHIEMGLMEEVVDMSAFLDDDEDE